jgi:hypothetical protein
MRSLRKTARKVAVFHLAPSHEVVRALGGSAEVEELADLSPGGFEVTRLSLSDEVFELDEDLFDWIEVGAVGRQANEVSAFGPDDGARQRTNRHYDRGNASIAGRTDRAGRDGCPGQPSPHVDADW